MKSSLAFSLLTFVTLRREFAFEQIILGIIYPTDLFKNIWGREGATTTYASETMITFI